MDSTNYKAALQTVRRMLNEGFYDTDYVIEWIDLVEQGKQDPRIKATEAVLADLEGRRPD